MKIVLNKCYGGFGLSPKAIKMYLKRKGKECYFYRQTKYNHSDGKNEFELISNIEKDECNSALSVFTKNLGKIFSRWPKTKGIYFYDRDIERTDPDLVFVVEKLKKEANNWASELEVIDIPDDLSYEISDYDGIETVEEIHRSW